MAINASLVGKNSTSGSSVTTAGGTTTTGSTFVLAISKDSGVSISSVSDNKGNTYTLIDSAQGAGSGHSKSLYRCENGAGGAGHTATVNFSGSAFGTAYLIECTGAAAASFDKTAKGTSGTSPFTVTLATLSQADEVIVTIFGTASSTPGYASSNMTILGSETDGLTYWTSCVAKVVVASTAAFSPSFTDSSGNTDTAMVAATFKQASGGGPSIAVLSSAHRRRRRLL